MGQKHIFLRTLSLSVLLCAFGGMRPGPRIALSQPVPYAVEKVVALLFAVDGKDTLAVGTGFFMRTSDVPNSCYLTTARHVLMKRGCNQPWDSLLIRFNRLSGGTDLRVVQLVKDNKHLFFCHPKDSTIDLAVVPYVPAVSLYDFLILNAEGLLAGTNEAVNVGDNVFFTGMFSSYIGVTTSQPIFRFGKIALFPREKILFKDSKCGTIRYAHVYLIEAMSFGGNSGSPVFRLPGGAAFAESDFSRNLQILGVISGNFLDMPTGQNSGVAYITPAYLLNELLFSAEVVANRKNR